ncbi:MAG: helix-turn-helix domain-containing protein [Actinomycetota bacterium]|nr:helix-turn-helix domain-containing protein [Actinomycetota bacterium]
MLTDVCAVIDEPVAAFELGVVCEVFGLDRSAQGLPTYDFAVVSVSGSPLSTFGGLTLATPHRLDRLGTADLVCVPAWRSVGEPPPEALLEALRDVVARGARVLAVCSGAFVLAAAGLLDGRRATTHWMYAERLARQYPQVEVDANVLYVDEGPVITSAGTAAGIDACLHVVRQEHGVQVANAVARRMVVPPHRDGGQAQFVEAPVPQQRHVGAADLAAVLDWAVAHLDRPLSVPVLARQAHLSERTFARRFCEVTGTTPHAWVLAQRIGHAQRLLEDGLPVEQVARRVGFGAAATLRAHFARSLGTSPSSYARTFR